MKAYTLCCYFFFSSRRRHTRFDCDWSSDVCSSDLPPPAGASRCRISETPRPCATAPDEDCRDRTTAAPSPSRSEEHTSELQSQSNLVCRLLLEKKKK